MALSAIKTYIRGFPTIPIDTIAYTTSTNYFIMCAQHLPDYSSFISLDIENWNGAVFAVITYQSNLSA